MKGDRKRNPGKGQSNPLLQIAANQKLRTIHDSACVAGNNTSTNEVINPIGGCVRLLVKTIPRVLIEDFEQSAAVDEPAAGTVLSLPCSASDSDHAASCYAMQKSVRHNPT